jgi:hypothetical protein
LALHLRYFICKILFFCWICEKFFRMKIFSLVESSSVHLIHLSIQPSKFLKNISWWVLA